LKARLESDDSSSFDQGLISSFLFVLLLSLVLDLYSDIPLNLFLYSSSSRPPALYSGTAEKRNGICSCSLLSRGPKPGRMVKILDRGGVVTLCHRLLVNKGLRRWVIPSCPFPCPLVALLLRD